MEDIAAQFGMSRSTAYRAARAKKPDPRLAELRKRKGPPVAVVIDEERFEVTPRAAAALDAAHAKLADAWRSVYEERDAIAADLAELAELRARVTQPTVAAPPSASAPVELPPWPLPWETPHPTEAVGQLFRSAMRGRPLPAASVALGLVDKAVATLTEFRAMLAEPAPAATGPPLELPAAELVPEPVEQPEPPKSPAEKSAVFAKMFPDLVKDQPPPGFGTPTKAP